MAACLGIGVAFAAGDFFLIFEAAIPFDYRAAQIGTDTTIGGRLASSAVQERVIF
jgi:hypothetical protein